MAFKRATNDVDALAHGVRRIAQPLDNADDLDPLINRVGDARYVLLGEASHGTSEFYTWRSEISRRLVLERGFSFIAVEGDWPDCYRVNRYVRGFDDSGESAEAVLHAFERWPTWMWANREVVELVTWLRLHNDRTHPERRVGFYGLDVYSLWDSMHAVVEYLEGIDPALARAARRAYSCFDPYHDDPQDYAHATALVPTSCEAEAVAVLRELRARAPEYKSDGRESYFNAEQNAHIGDARYTDMAQHGMINVGHLVRDRHDDEGVVLVGFGTHHGTVIAAEEWGAPMERMRVPDARAGSWEDACNRENEDDKLMIFSHAPDGGAPGLEAPRDHRAIGVVYNPRNERWGNYVPSTLPRRYDAFLYIDGTHGVDPLHMPVRVGDEPPETYPSGM